MFVQPPQTGDRSRAIMKRCNQKIRFIFVVVTWILVVKQVTATAYRYDKHGRRGKESSLAFIAQADYSRTSQWHSVLGGRKRPVTTKCWQIASQGSYEQSQTQLVTCSSMRELTRAVAMHLHPSDVVAELGSQLRDVSTEICTNLDKNQNGQAILVDVERKFPKTGKDDGRTRAMRLDGDQSAFFPTVATFLEISNLQDWRKALFFSDKSPPSYTALVLDVNAIVGNDLEWTFLSIVKEFLALNEAFGGNCRVVLIKSVCLNRLASRLVHGQRWIDGKIDSCEPPHLVATVGVEEYRQTILNVVRPGDAVLEVGCHLATSTVILHERALPGYCIGVDVGSSIIKGAQERYPQLFCAVGDAWRTADLLRLQQEYIATRVPEDYPCRSTGFDVVYVDVGGLSGSDGLLEALTLLSALEHALEPRCIVIKSVCMRRLSSSMVSFWQSQKKASSNNDGTNSA